MSLTARLREHWRLPLQAAAALAGAGLGFFDDTGHLGYGTWGLALTRGLVVVAAWLLVWVVARRFARPENWLKWLAAGVVLLAAACAAVALHGQLQSAWSCFSQTHGRRYVYGETFTRAAVEGRKFFEARVRRRQVSDEQALELLRETDRCQLVEGAQQNPEAVWEPAELRRRRTALAAVYVSVAPLFVLSFCCLAQALYCSRGGAAHEAEPGRMVFVSYASDDAAVAEAVSLALTQEGFRVFHDRTRLEAGRDYHRTIRREVLGADFFIFLISPASLAPGRYTLTELGYARGRWPDPAGRVLGVIVRDTPLASVPEYLKATTLLRPAGSVAAEVADAVARLAAGPAPAPADASAGAD